MQTFDQSMSEPTRSNPGATIMTSLRFWAFIPQIIKPITKSSAEAFSFWTWGLLLASNASAISYAVESKEDWAMAFKLVMPLRAARSS
jgi:hypothetical protein